MICFGTRRQPRVGLHRFGKIGRSTQYGPRLLQIVACVHCDNIKVIW